MEQRQRQAVLIYSVSPLQVWEVVACLVLDNLMRACSRLLMEQRRHETGPSVWVRHGCSGQNPPPPPPTHTHTARGGDKDDAGGGGDRGTSAMAIPGG